MKTLVLATDTELVYEFQTGNLDALHVLIERHQDKLYTAISVLVKDKQAAEEVFQNVFIQVIDTLRDSPFNEEVKFLSWAMRIAHTCCLSYIRQLKSVNTVEINADETPEVVVMEDTRRDAERSESGSRIRQIVDTLPAEQKEVLVLRHFAGLSFKAVAEITNSTLTTTLDHMKSGLVNLRKVIAEDNIAA